jgi:hypothetical protein
MAMVYKYAHAHIGGAYTKAYLGCGRGHNSIHAKWGGQRCLHMISIFWRGSNARHRYQILCACFMKKIIALKIYTNKML